MIASTLTKNWGFIWNSCEKPLKKPAARTSSAGSRKLFGSKHGGRRFCELAKANYGKSIPWEVREVNRFFEKGKVTGGTGAKG